MEVRRVPGKNRNSTYYTCDADRGFFYRVNKSKNDKKHLICVNKNCPARATCNELLFLKIGQEHNHLPDAEKEETLILKQSMVMSAASTSEDIKSSFVTQSARASLNVASKIAFPAVAKAMRRERRETQPRTPNTLQELGEICYGNVRYGLVDEDLFCRGISGVGNSLSVLFMPESLLNVLKETKELHIDGTFKCRPRQPASSQLFTIMAVQYRYVFPCAFALMTSRKTEAYIALFRKIQEIVPQLKPKLIMSDFESSIVKAVERCFPDSQKTGCFFHYCQAVLKKAKILGMSRLLKENKFAKKGLKLLMCVPLLPADKIEEAVNYITDFLRQKNLQENFSTLLTYHQRQWLNKVGANSLSVYKRTRRTNNDSESLHATLLRLLRIRGPNVWEFIDVLQKLSKSTAREIQTFIDEGLEIRSIPKRKYRGNSERIRRATVLFEEDGNIPSFLKMVSYCVETYYQESMAEEHTEIEDEEFILAPLPGDIPPEFHLNEISAEEISDNEELEEDEDEVPYDESKCMVCLDAAPTHIIMPCAHFGMCETCVETMKRLNNEHQRPDEESGAVINYSACPMDRTPIENYIRVHRT